MGRHGSLSSLSPSPLQGEARVRMLRKELRDVARDRLSGLEVNHVAARQLANGGAANAPRELCGVDRGANAVAIAPQEQRGSGQPVHAF
jgi:hypothetical protein